MSGCTESNTCPKCEGEMRTSTDWKPYDTVFHECLECGFIAYMVEKRMSLREVNELRAEMEEPPLKKLKKWVNK